jgi:hypothetical protein
VGLQLPCNNMVAMTKQGVECLLALRLLLELLLLLLLL